MNAAPRNIDMPAKHADGTERSRGNAFAAAYIVRSGKTYTPPAKSGPKKLLNSAGRPQATLEPMPSHIGIARPKTVEEIATAALTTSRVERSAQPSNRYAMKAGTR